MKFIILTILLSLSGVAQSDAIRALGSYIPLYDHQGQNDLGQRCSVDFIRRPGNKLLVEVLTPRYVPFLVEPSDAFTLESHSLTIRHPSVAEGNGHVTMSLMLVNQTLEIRRTYCINSKCWDSGTACHLDRW